jgi:Family of unknown function (DUF5989)
MEWRVSIMPNPLRETGHRETAGRLESQQNDQAAGDFRRQAEEQHVGFLGELLYMIKRDKQWWLVPILLMLLVLSALVFLGGTAAAPFIYTLF